MAKKISINKFLKFFSFLFAFVSLAFFTFYKIPFLSSFISNEINKNIVLLSLSTLAILFYLIVVIRKKESILPENKIAKVMLFVFPVLVLLSVAFSGNFMNSLFAKYIFLQSGVTLLAIFFSAFIVSSYFKAYERLSWILFILGGLFITLPVILALIFSKFGMIAFASKIVYFVESWDIVSVVATILVIISLLYYELIASTKGQKIFSGLLVLIHLVLLFFIIIPDIWYILTLSSLFIFLFAKGGKTLGEESKTKRKSRFYARFSFYVFIFSLLMSIIFLFSTNWTTKISNLVSTFAVQTSGINYSFIKPNFKVSVDLIGSQIKEGRFFGSGPSEFYRVWQINKPQSVIDSAYWGVEFTSSYSALTTMAVTLGIVGLIVLLAYIIFISGSIFRIFRNKERYENYFKGDDENRFYFLTSVVLFLFSTLLMIFFVNVILSFVLFIFSSALVLSHTIKWKEYKLPKLHLLFVFIIFLITLIGVIISVNRIRSVYITNNALANYQVGLDANKLESELVKAARISRDDSNYRLLSQFYLFKTRIILNSTSTDIETLQKDVLTSINNAITSAKTAINLDKNDYNNYLSLGSVYTFLMSIDEENKETTYTNAKEAYNTAIALYPKNPSLFLNLADLEYAYNQNSTTIIDTIKKSLEVKPNYSSAYYLFSQLAAQNNDRETALEFARQAIQADPQNLQAYLQFGILTLNKKDLTQDELNEAYTAFVAALSLDSNNVLAAYYLSITYTIAGDYENAYNLVAILDELLPENESVQELKFFLINARKNLPQTAESQPLETSTSTASEVLEN